MTTPGRARLRAMRPAKDAMDRDWADPGLDLAAVAGHAGCSWHDGSVSGADGEGR